MNQWTPAGGTTMHDGRALTFEAEPADSGRHRARLRGDGRAGLQPRGFASHAEPLSPATIRNVMADLEDAGFLYQPHTSAGRVPTASAYRFFAQQVAAQANAQRRGPEVDSQRAGGGDHAGGSDRARRARAGGGVARPGDHRHAAARAQRARAHSLSSSAGRARGGGADFRRRRDARQGHAPGARVHAGELDRTADYLNRHYAGWTLEAIRADLLAKLASERERYARLLPAALELCDPAVLESDDGRQVYVEGAAQFASAPELAGAASRCANCWRPSRKRASWWRC